MPTVAQMLGKFSASSTARVLDSILVPMEIISVTPASAARPITSAAIRIVVGVVEMGVGIDEHGPPDQDAKVTSVCPVISSGFGTPRR